MKRTNEQFRFPVTHLVGFWNTPQKIEWCVSLSHAPSVLSG